MHRRHTVVGMITILSALVSLLSFRVHSRASLELEVVALRHQVAVLRRQRSGRLRLFCADRLLWVWLYRIWPRALHAMVLVKPATVVQWHRRVLLAAAIKIAPDWSADDEHRDPATDLAKVRGAPNSPHGNEVFYRFKIKNQSNITVAFNLEIIRFKDLIP